MGFASSLPMSSPKPMKVTRIHYTSMMEHSKIARARRKMVVFTSPNPKWMKYLSKVPGAKTFFMDGWSYKELLAANRRLNLDITEKDIYERYMLFGGVARYCLGDPELLEQGKDALARAFATITSFRDVRDCLDDKKDANAVVHRLFHYLPNMDNRAKAKIVFGSKQIADMVNARLSVVADDDRRDLELYLNGDSRASSFRGWLFEGRCHDTLIHGVQYKIRSLDDTEKTEVLVLLEGSSLKRLKAHKILESMILDAYMRPDSCNFEAVDSFYLTNDCVYLFQHTVSRVHPVTAKGIFQALHTLGLIERFKNRSITVKLVFVVPSQIMESFQKQIIESPVLPPTEQMGLTEVPGIKEKRVKLLRDSGINSVRDLISAHRNGDVSKFSFARKAVDAFVARLDSGKETDDLMQVIVSIGQYVLGMESSIIIEHGKPIPSRTVMGRSTSNNDDH